MSKKTIWAVSIVLALIILASVFWTLPGDESLSEIRAKGVIRIGYAVEAPYAFIAKDGLVTGESPELARLVVDRLGGLRIEWRQTEFNSLISELNSGQIDVIAAGLFITPERANLVSFSEPTFHVRQSLLVRRGNPQGIHSYEEALNQGDIKIAVLSGSVEEKLLHDMHLPKNQIVIVPDVLTGKMAVISGLANGLALSSPAIQWIAMQDRDQGVEPADPFIQPKMDPAIKTGFGAFAFRKADKELIKAWNSGLEKTIGSPEHIKILERFGFSKEELPGLVTTDEILRTP